MSYGPLGAECDARSKYRRWGGSAPVLSGTAQRHHHSENEERAAQSLGAPHRGSKRDILGRRRMDVAPLRDGDVLVFACCLWPFRVSLCSMDRFLSRRTMGGGSGPHDRRPGNGNVSRAAGYCDYAAGIGRFGHNSCERCPSLLLARILVTFSVRHPSGPDVPTVFRLWIL